VLYGYLNRVIENVDNLVFKIRTERSDNLDADLIGFDTLSLIIVGRLLDVNLASL
jgi:hypothetical protein